MTPAPRPHTARQLAAALLLAGLTGIGFLARRQAGR